MTLWRYKVKVIDKIEVSEEVWAGFVMTKSVDMVDAVAELQWRFNDDTMAIFRIEYLEMWCDAEDMNWRGEAEVEAFEKAMDYAV